MTGHWSGYGAAGRFYRRCADQGMTQAETARAWGVTPQAVCKWNLANLDVVFRADPKKPKVYR